MPMVRGGGGIVLQQLYNPLFLFLFLSVNGGGSREVPLFRSFLFCSRKILSVESLH